MEDVAGETAELLTALIRNACVNDGGIGSGQEHRSAATIADYLDGAGIELETFTPVPGRTSLVARLGGTDPGAAALCYLSHTDVVPAVAERWSVDPFAGERVRGCVWGRGAVDMLNQAAAHAVAFRRLARSGRRLRGDVVLVTAADEENGGAHGAGWLCRHRPDAVACDYVVTEGGGFRLTLDEGAGDAPIAVMVGEKGPMWQRLTWHGVPGHGSMPHGTDNALLKAAEAVHRLRHFASPAELHELWPATVAATDLPDPVKAALLDRASVDAGIADVADTHPAAARVLHACTHTTCSPNLLHAGSKTNVIPDRAELDVDVRVLPGVAETEVRDQLAAALGDLFAAATVETVLGFGATLSPLRTPLWEAVCAATESVRGPSRLAPWIAPFSTDARFLRASGAVAYGFTLHDSAVNLDSFGSMFHGDDEHVSVTSLGMSVAVYEELARRLLG